MGGSYGKVGEGEIHLSAIASRESQAVMFKIDVLHTAGEEAFFKKLKGLIKGDDPISEPVSNYEAWGYIIQKKQGDVKMAVHVNSVRCYKSEHVYSPAIRETNRWEISYKVLKDADTSNLWLWSGVVMLFLAGMVATFLIRCRYVR